MNIICFKNVLLLILKQMLKIDQESCLPFVGCLWLFKIFGTKFLLLLFI